MHDETCRCEAKEPTAEGGGTDQRSCPVHAYEAGRRHERACYLEERSALETRLKNALDALEAIGRKGEANESSR